MQPKTTLVVHILLVGTAYCAFPKFRPPNEPNVPTVPDIPSFPKPVTPPKPFSPDGNPPAAPVPPEQVQSNMMRLEQTLGRIEEGVDMVVQIVDAILQPASSTSPEEEENTLLPKTTTTTTPPPSTTTSFPSSNFSNCRSYASSLRSCLSARPQFHSLDPSAQAFCACYTSTSTTTPCGTITSTSTSNSAMASAPNPSSIQTISMLALATAAFDAPAAKCRDFFTQQGFANAASVLAGRVQDRLVPGAGFCGAVDAELRRGGNATRTVGGGLPPTLSATSVGGCVVRGQVVVNGAEAGGRRGGGGVWVGFVPWFFLLFLWEFGWG
ncbi:hypothetical protein BU24DRAFT_466541 [Aaosphaeria arxii CBS 175.79]|uniref:Extracellular membrane protein CFEM domain-containing protein n=1 Tax=Aaosphaeria arxii CBS 175.79 TaxID=1450172 RepID=A0A6A5XCP2_9PLEO|nr:uncharacterized protein BU24DRAFT_466541 [Aaosphaeria arxii CBS 175.79]KAF2010762.1 hypothetical protein BU24DRAFT_466541 [Aaosphaeria arxii CBS 175.79]